MARLSLIVAAAENGVIGDQGRMPWHLPADLRHFRKLTMGKPVIMGRKTYESIGKPLAGRKNIVITRQIMADVHPDIMLAHSPDAALELAQASLVDPCDEVMIIGGAEIYRAFLDQADRIYLTRVHGVYGGDAVFPALSPAHWREIGREDHPASDGQPAYSFIELERA
ncbi:MULTISPECIES: dihydrofolate reductase [unclassified Iodidimonas]|uniref:dihydrofolate reductase n=1 Tax=unclassified Iodidimonas TaxID=2626145 RepID=UPI002482CE2F|nr:MULTISPECIES: dihydrofolate reductase [unclassified Iodidimonas]